MPNTKTYDLEQRTFEFAKAVRLVMKDIPYGNITADDIRQVVRSSGSIGANYIEANESLSPKDFVYRAKICRKEAKETIYWLRLLSESLPDVVDFGDLMKEAEELKLIFSSIIKKREQDNQ